MLLQACVPELALCLHSKGYVHGYKLLGTDDIPTMALLVNDPPAESMGKAKDKGKGGKSGAGMELPKSQGDGARQQKTSAPGVEEESKQHFNPEQVDFNATLLLRFLRANCVEGGTYWIYREQGERMVNTPYQFCLFEGSSLARN